MEDSLNSNEFLSYLSLTLKKDGQLHGKKNIL